MPLKQADPVIRTEGLSKRYGRRMGIERVDLAVGPGEIFGFLGPNGAGKTTTIRILLGFLRPGAGSARVLGRDAWRDSHRIKRDVGYLPGDLRLYPWMTCANGLRIAGGVRGRDLSTAGRAYAERFKLEMDVSARRMSRGMRQKLGLVLALAPHPRLLVLDEPTSGLDPIMQDVLADCLRELARDGTTIFFSSHTLSEVERLCDRVAIVRDGRIVADESLASLRAKARREVTLRFRGADAVPAEPPPFLELIARDGAVWRCELEGTATPLVAWAAGQALEDITVGPPDLETLFHRFYREPEGTT